jgi:hypothetical protein
MSEPGHVVISGFEAANREDAAFLRDATDRALAAWAAAGGETIGYEQYDAQPDFICFDAIWSADRPEDEWQAARARFIARAEGIEFSTAAAAAAADAVRAAAREHGRIRS